MTVPTTTASTPAARSALTLHVLGSDDVLHLRTYRAIVAGYTGRDEQAVRAHIDELAEIGVPAPPEIPMFYSIDADLVTTDPVVQVAGDNTSGEVEPVLVRAAGAWYLGVGSDHTDRTLETVDIAASKRACPKPVSADVIPVAAWDDLEWDDIRARSSVDGAAYQDGRLSGLRTPDDLLRRLTDRVGDDGADLVCFGGTLTLLHGTFVAGREWQVSLALPDGRTISHSYDVHEG